MKYHAHLSIQENVEKLYPCLKEEIRDATDRSMVSLEVKDKTLIITIHANDLPALRASFNSMTKSVEVFEKASKVDHGCC